MTFSFMKKNRIKKKLKEKDDKYDDLMKLTSGLYCQIKDNEEIVNSLDDKSKEFLEQVKSKLLLIQKLKGSGKK